MPGLSAIGSPKDAAEGPAADHTIDEVALRLTGLLRATAAEDTALDPRRRTRAGSRSASRGDSGRAAPPSHGSIDTAIDIHHTIGRGVMGQVSLAVQRSIDRHVAVKAHRSTLSDGKRDAAAAPIREAKLTGSLEHPNFVPVHELRAGEAGRPIVILKKIEGDVWAKLLGEPDRVRERHAATDVLEWHLRVLIRVAMAVHFAHSRGVLHLDIKP